ncbi:MAG TPA: quinol:cytochrome C oxidoreductase [Thermoguttaceae bacterium]
MQNDHPTQPISELLADRQTRLNGLGPRSFSGLGLLGISGFAAAIGLTLACTDGWRYFFHSYLLSYCFVLSISLGALFFVALQHATRAGWSVVVRRLAEFLAANVPCLVILFLPILIPVLLDNSILYKWASRSIINSDELLRHKAPYLDATFFAFRAVGYFFVWWMLSQFFLTRSLEQDHTKDIGETLRMERWSPLAIILFAGTMTFASIDWLMSLSPSFYSTIFGLYFFAGSLVAVIAALILVALVLQAAGRLAHVITAEHYHDLGKLLFTFVVFWGYIAFSQYLLIWYANIPEETQWYAVRQAGDWKWVAIVLVAGNLLIPCVGLLSRHVKRQKYLLGFWAVWLLVMHWIDLYWIVMPNLGVEKLSFHLMDICLLLGMIGIYGASLIRTAGNNSLVPLADPRLGESLTFENI